ncbi:MAG TPA: hypothetical protein VK438_18025 [Xanthobacteraceae bacterium]|nr:hypothetical protein [Xanthobacteraceae bacterium]
MRDQSNISMRIVGFAGIALAVGVSLLVSLPPRRQSAARLDVTTGSVSEDRAVRTTPIVPASVLEPGPHWAPLTGDGSN